MRQEKYLALRAKKRLKVKTANGGFAVPKDGRKGRRVPISLPSAAGDTLIAIEIPVRYSHFGRPVLPVAKPEPPAEKAKGFIRRVLTAENMSEAEYWAKIGASFRDDYRGGLRLYGYYDLDSEARHILPEALK